MDSITRIRRIFSWPSQRPKVKYPKGFIDGWFVHNRAQYLVPFFHKSKTILELGTWVGRSTRFFHDHSSATIVCVDHWLGSPVHQKDHYANTTKSLWDFFVNRCWDMRKRIIPVRMTICDALPFLNSLGLKPNFIFIDADHSYKGTMNNLKMCHSFWPEATITGHDYHLETVTLALRDFCNENHFKVESYRASREFFRVIKSAKD